MAWGHLELAAGRGALERQLQERQRTVQALVEQLSEAQAERERAVAAAHEARARRARAEATVSAIRAAMPADAWRLVEGRVRRDAAVRRVMGGAEGQEPETALL